MDVLTKEQRRRNMQAIRNKGSKAEISLAKALWIKGYRYRKNDKSVFGTPDLTFKKLRVAIFVDSEYFHGREWETRKHRIKTNTGFWWNKIEGNIKRDILVNEKLTADGWKVLRFWDMDILKDLGTCLLIIEQAISKQKDGKKIL